MTDSVTEAITSTRRLASKRSHIVESMNKKEILKQFIEAFNTHDIDKMIALIDEWCTAVSSTGRKIVGRESIRQTYAQINRKYGGNAQYRLGILNGKEVIVTRHRKRGRWTTDSIKQVEISNGKITNILSSKAERFVRKVLVTSADSMAA